MCEGRRKRVLGEEAPARAGGGHRRFPQGWCPQQGQPPPPALPRTWHTAGGNFPSLALKHHCTLTTAPDTIFFPKKHSFPLSPPPKMFLEAQHRTQTTLSTA